MGIFFLGGGSSRYSFSVRKKIEGSMQMSMRKLNSGKKVKRICIAPFVKLQLKALRYGSHRVAPANYTIPAFARIHILFCNCGVVAM